MIAPINAQDSWTIKKGYFDRHPKNLIFKTHSIEFGDQKLTVPQTINLPEEEPFQFRFGIKWIRGFKFTVGRKYQVFVRDSSGEVIKISFGSYYGRNKNPLYNQYAKIINQLWNNYFNDLADQYLVLFRQKIPFTLADVSFDEFGIKIQASGFIRAAEKSLLWQQVGIKNYRTYFAIFSKENPSSIHKAYNYLNDWNTGVLYSVVETILKELEM